MSRRSCLGVPAITALCCLFAPAAPLRAQSAPVGLDVSRDRASVVNNGVESTWTTERVQVSWVEPEAGGLFAGVERHARYGLVDLTGFARGYKRLGDWTMLAGFAGTPAADFFYRLSAEAELSRRVIGNLVASAGYRHMAFPAVTVRQVQPGLTWYHSRGELQGRLFLTSRRGEDTTSRAVLVQTIYDVNRRLRLRAGGARGDRIFDVSLLAGSGSARARVLFGGARIGVTDHDAVEIGGSVAHEQPAFDYSSFTVGYRRSF